ncbi:MAG: molybdenum cofactor guanylyltransferase MobA [Rhodobacteraceae bacterium]|nr:molybdenum cofactor guanylyltransferase MobA [Paracoccaceae bacterium]
MTADGVILAGGLARRMGGGDKGRSLLGGHSLLTRVIERLAPQVGVIALNANGDPDRFSDLGLPVLSDSVGSYLGPLAGVLAGLDWAAGEGVGHIVTVAADTPFFPTDLAERLVAAAGLGGLCVAAAEAPDGKPIRHPTFGLWPVALRDDLRTALEDGVRKVVHWTDSHGAATAVFPSDPFDPFFNVNTPEDLTLAEAMLP